MCAIEWKAGRTMIKIAVNFDDRIDLLGTGLRTCKNQRHENNRDGPHYRCCPAYAQTSRFGKINFADPSQINCCWQAVLKPKTRDDESAYFNSLTRDKTRRTGKMTDSD